jgi:hypothetical protein
VCVGAPVPTGWCVPCGIGLPDRPCRPPLAWGSLLAMSCLGEWGTAGRAGAFSSTRASRDAGPVFLNTTPHTKRLPSRRCGCRPLPKRLHSFEKTG